MKPALALVAVLLVPGCAGAEPQSQPQPRSSPLSQEQACAEAEEVTDAYQDGLGDASTPEGARSVIDGAIDGLRGIDAAAPVGARVDDLAAALSGLLEQVEAGAPPAQLQPRAAAIGSATTALARACGRSGQ